MTEPTDTIHRETLFQLLKASSGKLRKKLRTLLVHDSSYFAPKAREMARRERRAISDLHSAVRNYSGWALGGKLPLF